MKLLEDLGLSPDLTQTSLSPGARRVLEQTLALNWKELLNLQLDPRQEDEIRHFLQGFIVYHLERIPKGRARCVTRK